MIAFRPPSALLSETSRDEKGFRVERLSSGAGVGQRESLSV